MYLFVYRVMSDNRLGSLRSDGLLGRLPSLLRLDLRRAGLLSIEPNAFEGAAHVAVGPGEVPLNSRWLRIDP